MKNSVRMAYGKSQKLIESELSFLQFRSGIAYMVIPFLIHKK